MSEETGTQNWLSSAGNWAIGMGFVIMMIEMATGGDSGIGASCCCFGVFGLIAGGIVSSSGAAVSSDGAMVLKQDNTGQWNWVANSVDGNTAGAASHFNDKNTQIMSRVISEVRNGKPLQDLEANELDIVASAYGVGSGSREQKIEALHNSDLAKKAMKLSAIGVAGGAAAIGTSHIIKSGRERAIQRAEELREEGRERLRENIEAGKYNINSKLPVSESGEQATDVANNIILDQLKKQIEERNLTPEKLLELGDLNKDGKLDANEIAGALTAATGFAVPVFIVSDSMKEFDSSGDGTLDYSELNQLWIKLGLNPVDETEFSDEEIDRVLEEVDSEQHDYPEPDSEEFDSSEAIHPEEEHVEIIEEIESENSQEDLLESITEVEYQSDTEPQDEEIPTEIRNYESNDSIELSENIETEFEQLIVEMEGARFSSERKELMEKQTSEFMITMRVEKMERTLLGDAVYRGGQSVHALLDGGPYIGVVKIPVSLNDRILQHKEGDEIQVWASLVDFSPSLKRPVLEASELV